jgi:L-alanine-DL-glutamate epimerase-like enolase superfamily enzyme
MEEDMKIRSVEVFLVNPPKYDKFDPLYGFSPVVAKINTDEGISGYGEAIAYGEGTQAIFGITQDLARVILGSDPFDSERIWERLRSGWVLTGGPITYSGVSAIDIALWDIKGKALGVPVYKLLGGKNRDKIKVYLSHTEFGWPDMGKPLGTPEDYYKSAKIASDAGYTALKANFFRYDRDGKWADSSLYTEYKIDPDHLKLMSERVEAVQEALGPKGSVILDNNALTSVEGAIETIKATENSRILFFEEPIVPNLPDSMKLVADNTDVPIATGERLSTRWGFYPYLQNGSIRVVQPDLGNTGGLSEAKKIADLALLFGAQVSTHVCGGPLAEAAALHFAAAVPNFLLHEHHAMTFVPENRKFAKYSYEAKNGYLDIPEIPGIGQELSEYAVSKSVSVLVE